MINVGPCVMHFCVFEVFILLPDVISIRVFSRKKNIIDFYFSFFYTETNL